MGRTQQIASFTIVLGLGVLALKAGAWWLTNSAALFSDALESTVNVAAALIAITALRLAEKPADANHPYGHEKAEFFAAVIEGALIIVAAIEILHHAWQTWREPAPITAPWAGLALNALATAMNAIWAGVLVRAGRANRSMVLTADGRHLWADVVSSGGIAAGLGDRGLDGVSAGRPGACGVVAAYVLWSGMALIGDSVGGLMDAAPAADVVERIRRLVADHAEGALEAHDLRTRHAGRLTYLEFHLVVPGATSVSAAHAICDRIEAALRQRWSIW